MKKVQIKLGIIGYLPFPFNQKKILKWQSDIFEIIDISEHDIIAQRSDKDGWIYSDELLDTKLPLKGEEDIFIGVTYIPLENNWYSRILKNNRLIISYYGLHRLIVDNNIPIENLILRLLYAASIALISKTDIPTAKEGRIDLIHDDTRACIFDMNGIIGDVIYSLDRPQLCNSCINMLKNKNVDKKIITQINQELKKIKKDRYRRIELFIKAHPLISIIITIISGIIISMAANYLYDTLKNTNIPENNSLDIINLDQN